MLIFTILGTAATIISTIIAVNSKNEAKKILVEIKNERNRNASNEGKIFLNNEGENSGVITGINTGDIK